MTLLDVAPFAAGRPDRAPRRVDEIVDLSLVIPTINERANIELLLPELSRQFIALDVRGEVLVVDGGSTDGTVEAAGRLGARTVPVGRGFGAAILAGFQEARGRYVITMDADLSHGPDIVQRLWSVRDPLVIAIASRYVAGGSSRTHPVRETLSRILNAVFRRGLSLPVRDMSSNFRLYPASATQQLEARATDFDILPELLVRAHGRGFRIVEVPFDYRPRRNGSSKARVIRLGAAYLRTFVRLWRLRNSIDSADYDERAFDSPVPLQRAWQRRRHAIVTREAEGAARIVDIGCGSSRILRDLPNAVGIDINAAKLRYMRRYGLPLVNASIFALPFRDASADVVVCSEVIEHVPEDHVIFRELARVTRSGGRLVLGTPDYARRSWRWIEALYRVLAPGGYADEHITQYTHDRLRTIVSSHGFRYLRTGYVLGSEMILTFEKA